MWSRTPWRRPDCKPSVADIPLVRDFVRDGGSRNEKTAQPNLGLTRPFTLAAPTGFEPALPP